MSNLSLVNSTITARLISGNRVSRREVFIAYSCIIFITSTEHLVKWWRWNIYPKGKSMLREFIMQATFTTTTMKYWTWSAEKTVDGIWPIKSKRPPYLDRVCVTGIGFYCLFRPCIAYGLHKWRVYFWQCSLLLGLNSWCKYQYYKSTSTATVL